MAYDSTPIQAPRAAGALLRALTGLAENPLTSNLLAGTLLESAGIVRLRQVPAEEPLPVEPPVFAVARALAPPEAGRSPAAELALLDAPPPDPPAGSHPFRSSRDFVRAYQEGRTDPVQVAERILAASASGTKPRRRCGSSSPSSGTTCCGRPRRARPGTAPATPAAPWTASPWR